MVRSLYTWATKFSWFYFREWLLTRKKRENKYLTKITNHTVPTSRGQNTLPCISMKSMRRNKPVTQFLNNVSSERLCSTSCASRGGIGTTYHVFAFYIHLSVVYFCVSYLHGLQCILPRKLLNINKLCKCFFL